MSLLCAKTTRSQAGTPPRQRRQPDAGDFRNRLSTADREGRRQWLFPKKVSGRWYARRTFVSWVLLAILFAGPFIRIQGNPLLLVNIVERKFSILGQIFWPQDGVIFALTMLLFLTAILIFTAAFGRLWCGWTCPQTLLMEMVFRKIEYAIEGDAHEQRALRASPWTIAKLRKKLLKHSIFFGLSFLIGNTLLSYIIGPEALFEIVTDDPRRHLTGLSFMLLFTLVFYSIFARFREQACTFICPYGRFQSVILDENSMVVAYDHRRGEQRAPLKREHVFADRLAQGHGDCINCRLCVAVCPTGIDIRNGTQMECVNCTACIDACDGVMDKIGRPRGLIRYASLNSVDKGEPFRFTPRLAGYTVVLAVLTLVLSVLVFTRSDVETTLLRAPGALFLETAEGQIENLYTLKILNKTSRDIPVRLQLEDQPGTLKLMGASTGELLVPKAELAQTSVLVVLDQSQLPGPKTKLQIGIYAGGERLETVHTVFIGPRDVPLKSTPK
ncbi:MAG: cytochrome c oxidase accessory protein CcoG [Verrucomicrobiota bacterium]